MRKSGFAVAVSEAGFDEFDQQVKDVIKFLRKRSQELRRLRATKHVEEVVLDSGVRWKNTFTHADHLPRELIRRAGELNIAIELSHYPISR